MLLEELLYSPAHSLIDQSLHARMGVETTNGDGFGIGWYTGDSHPGIFHGVGPAWNNQNLRNLTEHINAPVVLAHIRAATGTAVQETNCHPFRFGRWLWMHNGAIADFHTLKRDLVFAVAPELYPHIEGSTDSETMFFLALTFGLRDDPVGAVERMVGFVESVAQAHGVANVMQMTIATSDGVNIYSFRYSTAHESRSLFYSADIPWLREIYPDNSTLQRLSDEARLIVSEPLGDLPGAWISVPESTYGIIQPGEDVMAPFKPVWP